MMKLAESIWKELGELAQFVSSINHDDGIIGYNPTATEADKALVQVVVAAHDPVAAVAREKAEQEIKDSAAVALKAHGTIEDHVALLAEAVALLSDKLDGSSIHEGRLAELKAKRLEVKAIHDKAKQDLQELAEPSGAL